MRQKIQQEGEFCGKNKELRLQEEKRVRSYFKGNFKLNKPLYTKKNVNTK